MIGEINIKYIFTYIRADGEEIDIGFFDSWEEANEKSKTMAGFGALTSKPIEIEDDYKLYKG